MTVYKLIEKYKKLQKEYETITIEEVIKDLRTIKIGIDLGYQKIQERINREVKSNDKATKNK